MATEVRPLVFLGTPHAAAVVLQKLIDSGFVIAHVVTRPDAKRGRGGKTTPSPVKEIALAHNISVSHDMEWLREHSGESLLGIVVAYGRIIPASVLQHTPMINVHFSLLPRWRGAAPVERAILAGDTKTGVCIMDVETTLDTGAVYASQEVSITSHSTADTLTTELAHVGAELLISTLHAGLPQPVAQSDDVTYAEKISPEEGRIKWNSSPEHISRQVRALRAFTECDGARVRILEVAPGHGTLPPGEVSSQAMVGTGGQCLQLITVQPEGKSSMDASAWLRGRPNTTRFVVAE